MDDREDPRLRRYYETLYPSLEMGRWMCYGSYKDLDSVGVDEKDRKSDYFLRREFCFVLPGDIFNRYQCFSSAREYGDALTKRVPIRIEIGPVYNYAPSERKKLGAGMFQPKEKEIIFDIDLTDYDDVRTCCQGANVCEKCWVFIDAAVHVLEKVLQEDFGFRHLLWVFSGRRGVHCWVGDRSAREFGNDIRSGIADYLQIRQGGDDMVRKIVLKKPLYPSIEKSYEYLLELFETSVIQQQGVFSSPAQWKKVLALVPSKVIQDRLEYDWSGLYSGQSDLKKWKSLKQAVQEEMRVNASGSLGTCIEEIVMNFMFPRLDSNVTKTLNHLLKAPFCIHPKTDQVCIPIDPSEDFDLECVPKLSALVEGSEQDRAWLDKSVQVFGTFLDGIMEEAELQRRKEIQESETRR